MGKVKQTLSILLAVAMVVTCIPQTSLTAKAAEPDAGQAVESVVAENDEATDIVESGSLTEKKESDVEESSEEVTEDEDEDADVSEEEEISSEEEAEEETPEGEEVPAEEETEAPAEEEVPAAEEEAEDAKTILADGEEAATHTVTITNFDTVKSQLSIKAVVGTDAAKTLQSGTVTVPDKGNVTLTMTAKTGKYIRIKVPETDETVRSGDKELVYTLSAVAEDKSITVNTVAIYDIEADTTEAGDKNIKLDDSLKDLAGATTVEGKEDATAVVAEKDGKTALKFTVDGYTYVDTEKLHVSYIVDGSDADVNGVEGAEVENATEVTAQILEDAATGAKSYYYEIPVSAIASAQKSVKIVVVKEEQVSVDFTAHDDVTVQVPGKVTGEDGKETDGWVEAPTTGAKVFAGDSFEFKATTKSETREISKVLVNGKPIAVTEDGEYAVTIEGRTTISFETVYSTTKRIPLTFTVTGDPDSATAEITSITPEADEDENATEIKDADEIAAYLGIELAEDATTVEVKAGAANAVQVPDSATAVTVKVTPANGYALKADGEDTAKDTFKFAKKVEDEDADDDIVEIGTAMAVRVETEIPATTKSVFFQPEITESSAEYLSDLTVTTVTDKVVQATKTEGDETTEVEGVFEVKEGVETVAFTVKAAKGYALADALEQDEMVKSVTAGAAAADGSVVYTVTVFASKITSTEADSATSLSVAHKALMYKAEITPAAEDGRDFTVDVFNYITVAEVEGESVETENVYTEGADTIPYGAKLVAELSADYDCRLTSVTWTMGDQSGEGTITEENDVEVTIPEVTADVTIAVETSRDYALAELTDMDGYSVDTDEEDGIYQVEYDGAYMVGVTEGGVDLPASQIKAVVKNEAGETVCTGLSVTGKDGRKINLAPYDLGGQEITVEMYVVGVERAIGEYVLNVSKPTTKIVINKGENIVQDVDSEATYEIETDGELNENVTITGETGLIKSAYVSDGKLVVTTNAKAFSDIATVTPGSDANTAPTVTYKKAIITVTAADDLDVQTSIELEARELFDESTAPTVKATANGAADTKFHVDVDMKGIKQPLNGSLWYEVTAIAQPAGTDADAPKFPTEKLQQTVTVPVRRDGDSQRIPVQVGISNKLGEGAEWTYDVTVKMIYRSDKTNSSAEVAAVTSEKTECSTVTPLFTTALKLTKGTTTLYTGQTQQQNKKTKAFEEIVIATPSWKSDKYGKYQILDDIEDDKYGLNFAVKNGNIVVTSVDDDADLGKHTITVTATADETTNHTMYASRATTTVTVVKGINNIIVTTPSVSIYKPEGTTKAATLKLGVDYNHDYLGQSDAYSSYSSWDGKKYVSAPKTKKVTWEIVGADTYDDEIEAPENIKSYVTVKNGTVTVNKNFTRDEKHAVNNRFMVKVTAADYAGNEVSGLSDVIEISNNATDISKLVILHQNSEGKYEVTAAHDITDKKAVEVLASDVNGGYVYAMPADAAVETGDLFDSFSDMENKLPVVNQTNITVASSNSKIMTISGSYNGSIGYRYRVNVLTAGKKAAIKVTTADGSNNKKTHTMNLTLGYKASEGNDLALKISRYTDDSYLTYGLETIFDPSESKNVTTANAANVKETPAAVEFNATGAARLRVQLYVGDAADGASKNYTSPSDIKFANYKLAVKGGKVVTNANGYATILTTSKETTLTLTDLTPEAKKAGKKAYVYKLTNTAYNAEIKAPKVAVKNTLHAFGDVKDQKVAMTVLDASNKNAPFAKGKYAKVEVDWSARTDKNAAMLNNFAGYLSYGGNLIALNEDGSMELKFGANDEAYTNFSVGSYKLKVTVGTVSNGNFTAETLPATATVKVTKAATFTFKPTTTYKMSVLDGSAILTGKKNLKAGESADIVFYNLQNANVEGKSNNFTKLFKIVADERGAGQRLEMTNYLKAMLAGAETYVDDYDGTTKPVDREITELTELDKKKDLTGYISYYTASKPSYYLGGPSGTVKITVTPVKSTAVGSKYASNKAEVGLSDKDNTTQVNIMVGNEYVNVKYAAVDTTKPSNELEIDTAASKSGANAKGQVVLKTKSGAELKAGKSYSVTLKVVPASSYYLAEIDKAAYATATAAAAAAALADGEEPAAPATPAEPAKTKEDLIQQYGITVKVSVKASETPAKTPSPVEEETPETPEEPDEKTLAEVATELAVLTEWSADDSAIVVNYTWTDSAATVVDDEDAIIRNLTSAVNAYISAQGTAYAGITAATNAKFTIASDGADTATIIMTLSKTDAADEEVTITVGAQKQLTVDQAVEKLEEPKTWSASGEVIKVLYTLGNDNSAEVDTDSADAAKDALKDAVNAEAQKLLDSTYTVEIGQNAEFVLDTDNATATITVTLKKDGDSNSSKEVEITVVAEQKEVTG